MPASSPSRARPRITLTSLTVRRGEKTVVRDLDLEITAGRVFWVTGPNGAGKTSFLRALAGLDRPRAGRVHREDGGSAGFRYFHAETTLPGWSTAGGWERLVSALVPPGAGPTALRPSLGPRRRIRRLSTGERKRLLLDALLRTPGSLVLDEPYEHLSPGARRTLTGLIEGRARMMVVVVATNHGAGDGPGLHLEAGGARALSDDAPP